MRNAQIHPITNVDYLIVTSDNSGAIGEKLEDTIRVDYETLAYYSFRVAVMECIAAGGTPISITIQNFCGDDKWDQLENGVTNGLQELHISDVPITGSTESNFGMSQSALGIVIIGRCSKPKTPMPPAIEGKWAVIGKPLIGQEVLDQSDELAPLDLYKRLSEIEGVSLWPVGSKGILHEWNQFTSDEGYKDTIKCELDIHKSGGPSTCFILSYPDQIEKRIKVLADRLFFPILLSFKG
ncbi:ATP-binding protein [Pseudalkalibacillus sp. SCS-8]|uniref:ATP-binding protein n=1 Tax=Pseudalkalibacillus nanhaiensis TaxID=3115291 RepID=UPI0032DB101B